MSQLQNLFRGTAFHRVYSVVTLTPVADTTAVQQMPAGLSFQVTTVTDFTDFNTTFEITAP